jgi:D-alanine-D-alanine ligase
VKPLRVLALMHANLVPPDDVTGYDVTEVEWKMEFDVTETLRTMGHEVLPFGVEDDLGPLRKAVAD